MDKINIKGVPAVSSLKVEGKGMEIVELVKNHFGNLSPEQQEEVIRQAFVKTLDESLARGTNEGLIEVLQHCNLFPSNIPESEKEEWARRALLFRTAYDRIVASVKPEKAVKHRSTKNISWKNKETIERFLDASNRAKEGTYAEIAEKFGGIDAAQVAAVFKALREGKYSEVGYPAKEYDKWLPRAKGRKKGS